jgi:hypothetical protein
VQYRFQNTYKRNERHHLEIFRVKMLSLQIRIPNRKQLWIRIRKKLIRIHNTVGRSSLVNHTILFTWYLVRDLNQSLLGISVADPGSGAFLPPGSGMRDGAMVGSGSGTLVRMNIIG